MTQFTYQIQRAAQAFPVPRDDAYPLDSEKGAPKPGLTARQHTAIALRVPDSGTDWLDDMIRASLRDQFAGQALNALIGTIVPIEKHGWSDADFVREAYDMADAAMAKRCAK